MPYKEPGQSTTSRPVMSRPWACTHSRLISDRVSDEEHEAGKVRCVECGGIVPDPHLQRDAKKM